jgi:RTX calcium-binding nonapeptide repeat (4 copies)
LSGTIAVVNAGTRLGICAVVLGTLFALPATSQAAVTIGSDLAPDPDVDSGCDFDAACTVSPTAIPGGTLTSPIDGVVVRWRVRSAGADPSGDPVRLKVISPAGGGAYTNTSTSATESIPDTSGPTTFTFATQQPITTGDQVALDFVDDNPFLVVRALASDVSWVRWQPPLQDGQTRTPDAGPFTAEPLFNADVEPDCDNDGLGDETQDPDTASCNPPPSPAQCNGKQPTSVGTDGADTLVGTRKKDVIAALGGDDQVKGKNGKDVICGGDGNDTLKGGNGKDQLNGEGGEDTCKGGRGKDKGSSCETTKKIP